MFGPPNGVKLVILGPFSLAMLGKEPEGKCHSSKQPPAQAWQFNWHFPRLQPVFSAGVATRRLALQALRSASPVNGVLSVPHGSHSFVASIFSLSCHLTRKAEPSPPGFHIVLIFQETAELRATKQPVKICLLQGLHGREWCFLSCLILCA